MSSHPMDSVPMPEAAGSLEIDCGPYPHGPGRLIEEVPGYTADQLRSERISAYEMGRNAGLEEAAKMAAAWDRPNALSKASVAIRSLKK